MSSTTVTFPTLTAVHPRPVAPSPFAAARPPHRFERRSDGHYTLTIADASLVFDVARLWRDRHELCGELTVSCTLAGVATYNGILSAGNFNLSAPRARQEHAKRLAQKAKTHDAIDWDRYLEEFCLRVLDAERAGEPARLIAEYPDPSDDDAITIDGVTLHRRHPAILFGDGDSLKSYLALWLITRLVRDHGLRVVFADWELEGSDHKARLRRLVGSRLPDIPYVKCLRPLVAEAERIRRVVEQHKADYLLCDSVAYATSGAPEGAEQAMEYFRALRQIGVGSLNIAHVPKGNDDREPTKPFGSVYWHNSARVTWYVKRVDDEQDDSVRLALIRKKNNLASKQLPALAGFAVRFTDARTVFEPSHAPDTRGLAERAPLWQRAARHLSREGAQTIHELARALDVHPETLRTTLVRKKGTFVCITKTEDGVHRWAVADRRRPAAKECE